MRDYSEVKRGFRTYVPLEDRCFADANRLWMMADDSPRGERQRRLERAAYRLATRAINLGCPDAVAAFCVKRSPGLDRIERKRAKMLDTVAPMSSEQKARAKELQTAIRAYEKSYNGRRPQLADAVRQALVGFCATSGLTVKDAGN